MGEVKEWLPLFQLVGTGLTIVVTGGAALRLSAEWGRFAEKMQGGMAGIREDLDAHTSSEERRFDKIQSDLREQGKDIQKLTVTQATQDTRLSRLETVGSPK